MEVIATLFSATIRIFDIPVTLWGYSFSMWQVFLFTGFAGVAAWIVGSVFGGD